MSATHQLAPAPATVALHMLRHLEAAWNSADGAAFGALYASDASFVNIRGEHIRSGAAIGAGHHGIFTTIYAGSTNRMDLVRADQVSEGVVLAVSLNTLECPTGPLAGRHQAMSTSVITRAGEKPRTLAHRLQPQHPGDGLTSPLSWRSGRTLLLRGCVALPTVRRPTTPCPVVPRARIRTPSAMS